MTEELTAAQVSVWRAEAMRLQPDMVRLIFIYTVARQWVWEIRL